MNALEQGLSPLGRRVLHVLDNVMDLGPQAITAAVVGPGQPEAPVISLCHATRERPDMMWKARKQWLERAADTSRIEHIFGMDEDDPLWAPTADQVMRSPGTSAVCGRPAMNNPAWDRSFAVSRGKVIVQMSDDFEPPAGWDNTILARLGDLDQPKVLGVGDPHFSGPYSGNGMLTLFICTRAYVEERGYWMPPGYPSMMSDYEMMQVSALMDRLVDAFDVHFYHHWHGAEHDPCRDLTYARHASTACNCAGWDSYNARENLCFPDLDENLKPFHRPGSVGESWAAQDWAEVQRRLKPLICKYHKRVCGGRFDFYTSGQLWNYCSKFTGAVMLDHETDMASVLEAL